MSFYDHFRPEEHAFVEKVADWADIVQERYQRRLTNFLDPREQFIVQSVVGRLADINVSFFGGYEQSERKRALIYPEYDEVSPEDFQVTLLSIEQDVNVSHRDVLGSLLGIGLKREKFGDILIADSHKQLLVAGDIADYVLGHFHQVSRYHVTLQTHHLDELVPPSDPWQSFDRTVSSLRLDVILSELLPLSRSKVTTLIKGKKVKVNWRLVEQAGMVLQKGDILSVKGFGRFLFSSIQGQTKKGNIRVSLGRKENKS
ncbi:RNA-binding protein [Caldalkalibacillus salinus]|uniref:YlmH family RNA-binding protein n=1 Tax=Caldalkalibacillus salinus TaxID=2803787 RepID=UPI001920966F|nr:YlmH/Sll1252 family protein [Caldalkalibacillus salinus]